MGDRGNIIITGGTCFPHPIYFYTHWSGSSIPDLLAAALVKGKSRWDDPQYLGRIIYDGLLRGDQDVTGYGISGSMRDGGTEYLVNMETKRVFECRDDDKEKPVPFGAG